MIRHDRENTLFARPLGLACWLLAAICWGVLWSNARAQGPRPQTDPREPSLFVPSDAPIRRGEGRHVTLQNTAGQNVVALLHAEVGDRRLVIQPDGRLESVPAARAPITTEPFRPATKEEIAKQLHAKGCRDFKVRSTTRFIYVYNSSEAFCKGTSRILETMYPAILAYFKRLKLPVDHPQVPLVAVMFRTEEEFQKFEPVPDGIAAYYNSL